MFILKSIKIFDGCQGQKNLKAGTYTLCDDGFHSLPYGFFGENICVSAIVGKNGSGKSSLLDILYRVMNNLCAVLCTNLNRVDDTAFSYVCNVRAEIEYETLRSNVRDFYRIKCFDNAIYVDIERYVQSKTLKFCFGDCQENDGYKHYTSLNDFERARITNDLFYTIVVNYAPFTLNSKEYESELCLGVNNELKPDKIDIRNHNWLQSIFHKNDGYQSCITLVPYRDYGSFDATKEAKLARERILEILCTHKAFIDGYKLKRVHFNLNKDSFKNKFSLTRPTRENGYKPKMEVDELIQIFEDLIREYARHGKDSITSRVLDVFGFSRNKIVVDSLPHTLGYLYLVYKVLNCANYPTYAEFSILNNTNLVIEKGRNELLNKATVFAKAVKTDHSHITFKIERIKKYLSIIDNFNWDNVCSYGFDLDEYFDKLGNGIRVDVIPIAMSLPPSFFGFEIFLEKEDNEMSFERLSSGERQFYYTISAIIYHMMNLISIGNNDYHLKYNNVLVVLDEVELCFHPDYQRVFIERLLSTIKRLRFNKTLGLHILLTSHSPFILSDIPTTNILYLKEGSVPVESKRFINPFGANLNDILSQSFFLNKSGFIGEHAKSVINSLIQFLSPPPNNLNSNNKPNTNGNSNDNPNQPEGIYWTKDTAKIVIDSIGEPLIRTYLREMFAHKFQDADMIRRQIAELNEKLREYE